LTVKRVAACADGMVVLLGDNRAESIDSRHYGPVSSDLILGRVRRLTTSRARTLSSVE